MNPALWGAASALGLGTADFAARFSSRAIGYASAWLGVLLVGALLLSLWIWLRGAPLIWDPSGFGFLIVNGIATTVMALLLYLALARGPVSVVAPIVASHPVLVVAFWVAMGTRPDPLQWLAMAATVAGAAIVARSGRSFVEPGAKGAATMRWTLIIAACSALAYAVLVIAGQLATPIYGELQTLWLSRLISLVTVLIYFAARRQAPSLPMKWWPFLGVQGLLDGSGYLFLFLGSGGPGAEIAAVTASAFGAVTTLLARIFLREAMTGPQWCGIALVFGGVAVLSW